MTYVTRNLYAVMSGGENGLEILWTLRLLRIDEIGTGKLCIEVKPSDKIAFISEFLCIGCGICVKKYVLNPSAACSA